MNRSTIRNRLMFGKPMARQILTRFDPDKKKLLFYDEKSARVRRALMFSLFVSSCVSTFTHCLGAVCPKACRARSSLPANIVHRNNSFPVFTKTKWRLGGLRPQRLVFRSVCDDTSVVIISQSELSSTMCSSQCSVFNMAVQFDAPLLE